MIKRVKGLINNQKGLTLVELLAVIVILGIIAAIAVPSIGKIIDNSKKDAHLANAQQMISAAKLAVAANEEDAKTPLGETKNISLEKLQLAGYLDEFTDPDSSAPYSKDKSFVEITNNNGKYTYTVTLVGSKRTINNKKASELNRDSIGNTSSTSPTAVTP
ncbi:type II secretion system protein [Peribacillus loiseleuriae]|uniref:Uncharacterized protein n=1 Tax=Peribacillus loiseleuriae TaxID=1679170 RepID=A0A0K9GWN8_9BACI|nr:type II secretion system protein [Peribacillus loiseleuriae]KMY51109.1 hypothetical protein AC625_17525 [Peribacillus loiseleuriae]